LPTKPEQIVEADTLLDVRDLEVHFALRGGFFSRLVGREEGKVKAVDGVSFALRRGEVLGVVGESGSGKTTLGRALMHLAHPPAAASHSTGVRSAGSRSASSDRCAAGCR